MHHEHLFMNKTELTDSEKLHFDGAWVF
jgi:hypothetical protein